VVMSRCIDGCIIARDIGIGMLYWMSGAEASYCVGERSKTQMRTFKIVSYFGAMSVALFSSSREK
jgi:hypothetical protein